MDILNDQQLAIRAANGDAAAFSTLLERHYMTIYRFAYKWAGNRDDAQDIAQEVCLKLGSAIAQFKGDAKFTTWLYRITVNAAKDMFASRKRTMHNEAAYAESSETSTSAATQEDSALARELYRAIYTLPETLREAILLVLAEGLSHKEAGEILGCAEGTISWRVSEGRKILQDLLVMPSNDGIRKPRPRDKHGVTGEA